MTVASAFLATLKRVLFGDLTAAWRSYWQGAAAHRASRLGMAVVAARAISAMGYIAVARLYVPADFGVFAMYLAGAVVLASLAGASYDRAIVAEETPRAALSALLAALLLGLGLAGILLLFLAFTAGALLGSFHFENAVWMLWAMPAGMMLKASYRTFEQWAIRRGTFRVQGIAHIGAASTQLLLQVGLAFAPIAGPYALLLADLGGGLAGFGIIAVAQMPTLLAVWKHNRGNLGLAHTLRRWLPTYALPSGLIGLLVQSAPVLLLAPLYSPAVVGQVAMATRILELPHQLAASIFSNIAYHRIASATRVDRANAFRRASRQLLLLALAIYGAAAASAVIVIPVVLGAEWSQAALHLMELVPFYIGLFTTAPLMFVYVMTRRESHMLSTRLILLSAIPLAYGMQQAGANAHVMLITFSVAGALACAVVFADMYGAANSWRTGHDPDEKAAGTGHRGT